MFAVSSFARVQQSTSPNTNNCISCVNCAKCAGITHESLNTWRVKVDLSDCKGGSSISWACCESSGNGARCDLYDCNNANVTEWEIEKAKCNEITEISFLVPENTQFITIQLHDGKFLGTVDPSNPPAPLCGGSGTSCSSASLSGVCRVTIDLSTCHAPPECIDNIDCLHLSDSCATGICDVAVGGVCKQILHPMGRICRPPADLCDVPETCTGVSASCPLDVRKDHAYTYKCSTSQFLCGITQNELTIGQGGYNYFLGTCGIGTADSFHSLPWPSCATGCIQSLCPNNRLLSNYALATCDPLTGEWLCTQKIDVTETISLPVCPYTTP